MKLSNEINDGIFQNMDDICGTTVATYPNKKKVSHINDALDWYLQLAFKADNQWTIDDNTESLPPIDTQNIVSGTNRYKLSSFAEKIINLIKLEIDDENGNGLSLIPETIQDLYGSFDDVYVNADAGTPTHYLKYGDFIYLRPNPNYNATSGLRAYFNRPLSKFEFVSCQPEADDELITAVGHGLVANDTVIFNVTTGGTMAGNLTADTQYYVISSGLTTSVFKVSTTQGGSAVNISSDGSGVTFLKTSGEPGITSIHHPMIYRKASLQFLSNPSSSYKLGMLPQLVSKDEMEIEKFYSNRTKDERKRFTAIRQDNR